nr:hypothetical protein [Mucilaginibacter sp. X5P1]
MLLCLNNTLKNVALNVAKGIFINIKITTFDAYYLL